ncbi:MAG TPA: hypothetical protein VN914_06650 [Polyangia bacterium]|nr:hypothetical protein [Polyangia bacterium]
MVTIVIRATARFNERKDGLRIVISPPRRPLVLLVPLMWAPIAGLAFLAVLSLFTRPPEASAVAVVLVLFVPLVLLGLAALVIAIWMMFGREVVTTDGSSLTIRCEALGLGWTNRYDLAEVEHLRVSDSPGVDRADADAGRGGSIVFIHRAKAVRFGAGLDTTQAQAVIDRLRARDLRWR